MEQEQRKLFVGGVSQETCEETLKQHFKKYGEVIKCEIIKHRTTGCSRGFGFVTFADPSSLLKAIDDKHVIRGRSVEVKQAVPKGQKVETIYCQGCNRLRQQETNRVNGSTQTNVKKIFVGGLPTNLNEEEFKSYFESFGTITDAVMFYDKENRPRGFGFVTFESEEVVVTVLQNRFYTLKDKRVEVKRAVPKLRNNDWVVCFYDSYNNGLEFGEGANYGGHNGFASFGHYCNNCVANMAPKGAMSGWYYGANFQGPGADGNVYYRPRYGTFSTTAEYYQLYLTLYGNPYIYPQSRSSIPYVIGENGGLVVINGSHGYHENGNDTGAGTSTSVSDGGLFENGNGHNHNVRITAGTSAPQSNTTGVIVLNGADAESTSSNSATISAVEFGICSFRLEDYGAENQKEMDGQSSPSVGQSSPSDGQSSPSDGQSLPSNGQSSPSNGQSFPNDGQSSPATLIALTEVNSV